jgi:hypothetical protein
VRRLRKGIRWDHDGLVGEGKRHELLSNSTSKVHRRWWRTMVLGREIDGGATVFGGRGRPVRLGHWWADRLSGPVRWLGRSKWKWNGKSKTGWAAKINVGRTYMGHERKTELFSQFSFSRFDLNSKFKFKLDTLSNPDKFKYFTKIETWDFRIKIILRLNLNWEYFRNKTSGALFQIRFQMNSNLIWISTKVNAFYTHFKSKTIH